MLARDVTITNSAGIHAIPIAEQALAGILALLRGVDVAGALQRERKWSREPFLAPDSPMREVGGLRALILGAGGLGQALGVRLAALGVRVVGSRRRVERGVPPGFERVVGPDAWRALLPESDIVALCAPSTKETQQMLGAAELDRLPHGAIIVNVARGALLDEEALAARVRTGALRGAVLDVFSKEPLPPESPLWELPSVIMTPHVSGVTDRFWEREMALFEENWLAYDRGLAMRNVVDKKAGY
jgi:phosphoglycerate dehydrogenase-like enzyme